MSQMNFCDNIFYFNLFVCSKLPDLYFFATICVRKLWLYIRQLVLSNKLVIIANKRFKNRRTNDIYQQQSSDIRADRQTDIFLAKIRQNLSLIFYHFVERHSLSLDRNNQKLLINTSQQSKHALVIIWNPSSFSKK